MKRDLDLCRRILLAIEEHPGAMLDYEPKFSGVSDETVTYQVGLLVQAGLVQAADARTTDGPTWIALTMTWDGHEFLDVARDETLWQRAKADLGDKVKSVSLEVLKAVLVDLAKSVLGLSK